MDKVRIGFVGVGGMGQCAHLKHYASLPECAVVSIAEVRPELAKRVAKKYDIPHVYADAAEMVAKEKLDGLVAPHYFGRHGIVLSELYKFGLPVFSEKPLAASIEVGEQLLAALKAGGSWHMVGYHKRSDPATMYAKAEIERLKQTRELGALRYVRIIMPAGDWVDNGFFDLLRSDEPVPQSNDPAPTDMDAASYKDYISFVNYYIHQVNMLRHLLGAPYHVTFADKAGVLLVAESTEGVTGTIEMSPYTTTVAWQESMLVAFEHGYVKVELPAPMALNRPGRVEILRDPGNGATPTETVPHLPWVGAMRQQAMNYLAAIRGEMKPMTEAAEALEDLRVARQYLKLWKGV